MLTAYEARSVIICYMGKAGKALKQVLTANNISQSKIASALGVERPIVFRWFHEKTDPAAETVAKIVEVLRGLNPDSATEFIHLYLGKDLTPSPGIASIVSGRQLPDSDHLNVSALSRLFSNTTNSYKYLFFLSLLDIINRRHFEVLSSISFEELVVEILANAWYPHTFFKLSFGKQDKIAQKLGSLDLKIEEPILQFRDLDKKLLRKVIASQNLKGAISHLRRYVPFRLIIPFLETELQGISRGRGNRIDIAMPAIADRYFDDKKPLYRFNSSTQKDCHSVIVHPDWATYLERHYVIVRSWVAWEWMNYMQKRNPSTPAIASKLFAPTKRDSLGKQTDYWKTVLRSQELRCIYSRQLLDAERLSLDHYLPWSFVAHDQLWNLLPTRPEVNSSKSNNLPDNTYFRRFVELQHAGLTITHKRLSEKQWVKHIEPYILEMRFNKKEDLLDIEKLYNAYDRLINPLISIASNQGFKPGWTYMR